MCIDGPVDRLTITRNYASTPASLIRASGHPSGNFSLRENTFLYGGTFMSESAMVSRPFEYYFPASDISGNVLTGAYSGEEHQITQNNQFPLAARKVGGRRMAATAPAAPTPPAITPQYF